MIFALINITLRAVMTLCTIYCVVKYGQRMNVFERIGAGIVGGSSIMTIPLIIDLYREGTPFDGWASSLLNIGFIFGFIGLTYRLRQHERRNAETREQARKHLTERGLL